jgi:hypothetical protein
MKTTVPVYLRIFELVAAVLLADFDVHVVRAIENLVIEGPEL